MASIRGADGGGPRLRKVKSSEKRDRSSAMVPGGAPSSPAPASGGGAAGGGGGGLADALQQALMARNKKVSASGKSIPTPCNYWHVLMSG